MPPSGLINRKETMKTIATLILLAASAAAQTFTGIGLDKDFVRGNVTIRITASSLQGYYLVGVMTTRKDADRALVEVFYWADPPKGMTGVSRLILSRQAVAPIATGMFGGTDIQLPDTVNWNDVAFARVTLIKTVEQQEFGKK